MPTHHRTQKSILHELPRRRQIRPVETLKHRRHPENAPDILHCRKFERQIRNLAFDAPITQLPSLGIWQTHDILAKRNRERKSRGIIRAAERLRAILGGTVGRAGFVRESVLTRQHTSGGRIGTFAKGCVKPR